MSSIYDAVVKIIPSYAQLFGETSQCDCDDCESVLSPAAYFVDLLQFLSRAPKNSAARGPLDILLERRPDLEHILLTCENSHTPLPAIDLVNEVLETIVAVGKVDTSAAHDTGTVTAEELAANPQFAVAKARDDLAAANYPASLPFDFRLETVRAFFEALGATRYDLMRTFRTDALLPFVDLAIEEAIAGESLRLSTLDFELITGMRFDGSSAPSGSIDDLYGLDAASVFPMLALGARGNAVRLLQQKLNAGGAAPPLPITGEFDAATETALKTYQAGIGQAATGTTTPAVWTFLDNEAPETRPGLLSWVTEFLARTQRPYADLVALLETKTFNPLGAAIAALGATDVAWKDVADLAASGFTAPKPPIVAGAAALGLTITGFVDWLKQRYDGLAAGIVIESVGDPCDIAQARLRRIDGGVVPEKTFVAFNRFLRLAQRTSLSIAELDCILSAFRRLTISDSTNANAPLSLAALLRLRVRLKLSVAELCLLLGYIETGRSSLYTRLFLNRAALALDPSFGLALDGAEMAQSNKPISDHVPALLAAFRMTADELALVRGETGLAAASATMSLSALARLGRYSVLARVLGISVPDLISLLALSSPGPFVGNPDQPIRIEQMVANVDALAGAKLSIATVDQLLRHVSRAGAGEAGEDEIGRQCAALHDAQVALAAEIAAASDNSLERFRTLLARLAGPEAVDQVLGIVTGSATFTAPYGTVPASAIVDAFGPNVSFAPDQKIVRFSRKVMPTGSVVTLGALTDGEKTALQAAAGADADLVHAVEMLYARPRRVLADVLAGVGGGAALAVDLLAHTAGARDVEGKLRLMIDTLLPLIHEALARTLIKQQLLAFAGIEASVLAHLLEDAQIATAPGSADPLIMPFRRLEGSGWSVEYFANTALAGAAFATGEIAQLSYDGNAADFGQASPVGSSRWSAILLPRAGGAVTFEATSNGTVALYWNGTPVPVVVTGQTFAFAPQTVVADERIEIVIEWRRTGAAAPLLKLAWINGVEPRILLPSLLTVPMALFRGALAAFVRLDKVRRLLRVVPIEPDLLRHVVAHAAAFGGFSLHSLPVERSAATAAAIDNAAPDIFRGLLRVIELAQLAPKLRGAGALGAILGASSVADANLAMASAFARNTSDIALLTGPTGFNVGPGAMAEGRALLLVRDALAFALRLGMALADLLTWAGKPVDDAQSEDVKRVVRAKFSQADWLALSGGLNDPLRERWRDALVAYLLPRMQLADRNQLFEYLFLDTEVSSCVKSTPIRHAIFAVLTFVQRIQLNLHNFGPSSPDTILPSAIDAEIWEGKKYYRVQEAARKVLMFPERYMRESLRDDRTPLFDRFEADLGRAKMTREGIETAFLGYLKGLDEIARLEICGTYVQTFDAGTHESYTVVHMIGRTTLGAPYSFYYRRLEGDRIWTPWERVPIDVDSKHDGKVEGVHVVPVIWNRRLYVFWPVFEEKADGRVKAGNAMEETQSHRDWRRSHDQWVRDHPKWEAAHDAWKKQFDEWRAEKAAWEHYWEEQGHSLFYPYPPPHEPVEPPEPIEPSTHDPIEPDQSHMEIRLAWCECFDDHWTSKQVSSQIVRGSELRPERYLLQIVPTFDGILHVDLLSRHLTWNWGKTASGDLRKVGISSDTASLERASWALSGVNGKLQTSGITFGVPPGQSGELWVVQPEGTVPMFNTFEMQPGVTGLTFNIGDYLSLNAQVLPRSLILARKVPLDALLRSPTPYRVTTPHHYSQYVVQGPCFYQDFGRTYIVTPARVRIFTYWGQDMLAAVPPLLAPSGPSDFGLIVRPHEQIALGVPSRAERIFGAKALLQPNNLIVPTVLPSPVRAGKVVKAKIPVQDVVGGVVKITGPSHDFVKPIPEARLGVRFRNLFHPHVSEFVRILSAGGVDALLSIATQSLNYDGSGNRFASEYQPTLKVAKPYPHEKVEFGDGSYAIYNWELFFHAPLLMSEICEASGLLDQEEWCLRRVLDITAGDASAAPGGGTDAFWQFLPFRGPTPKQIEDLLNALSYTGADPAILALRQQTLAQIDAWERDPFNPFLIGRMRIGAMQKYVVIRWLQYLILRARILVQTERPEAVNEAVQYLVLAAHLAGPKAERVPRTTRRKPESYATLKSKLDGFSNALVLLENEFPFSGPLPIPTTPPGGGLLGMAEALYFCIPANDLLDTLRDTIADLLFKIRHCMNLEGVVHELPLYEPPIDPMLLVEARARGVDLGSVLSELNAPLPHEFFEVALERADQVVEDVRRIGQDLRAALDARDNEQFNLIRARQELMTLREQMRQIKQRQVDEAKAKIAVLTEAENLLTKVRIPHFLRQLGLSELPPAGAEAEPSVVMSTAETSRIASLARARSALEDAGQYAMMSKMMSAIPTMTAGTSGSMGTPVLTMYFGGHMLALGLEAFAKMKEQEGADAAHQATLAQIRAEVERRAEQWALELSSAIQERERIDREQVEARIGVEIAEFQLKAHDRETEFAQERLEFLENKPTALSHHEWLVQELDLLLGQFYQVACDECKRVQQVYRFDTGDRTATFVEFGHFDKAHHGLLSGEWLALSLRKMSRAHRDQERYRNELSKTISLAMLDPMALVSLKTTGSCEFTLPESLYDTDFPGHYMRRLRRVAVTVPCVTGPYITVNATLTLLNACVRTSNVASAGYAETTDDPRFDYQQGIMRSIATSTAREDRGEFGDRQDGRRGPFEGYGAIARFRLEVPSDTNAFDIATMTDVLIRTDYWSLGGGQALAKAARKATLEVPVKNGARLFSLLHEFSNDWYRGNLSADPLATEQVFQIDVEHGHFPFGVHRRGPKVTEFTIMLSVDEPKTFRAGVALPVEVVATKLVDGAPSGPPQTQTVTLQSIDGRLGGLPMARVALSGDVPMRFELKVKSADLALVAPRFTQTLGTGAQLRYRLNTLTARDLLVLLSYDTAV